MPKSAKKTGKTKSKSKKDLLAKSKRALRAIEKTADTRRLSAALSNAIAVLRELAGEDVQPLPSTFLTEQQFKADEGPRKYCSAVIDSVGAGNWCTSEECSTEYPVGKKLYFRCDGEECTIVAGRKYYLACGTGETRYLSGCTVVFKNVSSCS